MTYNLIILYFFTKKIRKDVNYSYEIFVDFMAAQVKTLSFLAYVIKIYQVSFRILYKI